MSLLSVDVVNSVIYVLYLLFMFSSVQLVHVVVIKLIGTSVWLEYYTCILCLFK